MVWQNTEGCILFGTAGWYEWSSVLWCRGSAQTSCVTRFPAYIQNRCWCRAFAGGYRITELFAQKKEYIRHAPLKIHWFSFRKRQRCIAVPSAKRHSPRPYSAKSKLIEEMDSLVPDDKHRIKRKAALDDRLNRMYDKIEDTDMPARRRWQ